MVVDHKYIVLLNLHVVVYQVDETLMNVYISSLKVLIANMIFVHDVFSLMIVMVVMIVIVNVVVKVVNVVLVGLVVPMHYHYYYYNDHNNNNYYYYFPWT